MFVASLSWPSGWGGAATSTRSRARLLLLLLIGFNWYIVTKARPDVLGGVADGLRRGRVPHRPGRSLPEGRRHQPVWISRAGIVILVVGGRLLVTGAVTLARLADVSERIIGLTIVAIGTSLPELATSLVAARRGHAESGRGQRDRLQYLQYPGRPGVPSRSCTPCRSPRSIEYDMLWMLGFSVALFPMMLNRRISRGEGAALLAGWVVYIVWLLRQSL